VVAGLVGVLGPLGVGLAGRPGGRSAALRDDLAAMRVKDAQLAVVHQLLIDLVETKRLQVVAIADFLRSEDAPDVDRLRHLQVQERQQPLDVEAGIAALQQRVEESLDD
jgi:hypothetical protein